MAKILEVAADGGDAVFGMRRLSRAVLYGSKRRVAVDALGRECANASLTHDGCFILPAGSTAQVYLDECSDAVERSALDFAGGLSAALKDKDGGPFGCEAIDPADVLGCVVTRVHHLEPVTISRTIDSMLRQTGVCRILQDRCDADDTERAFLIKSSSGYCLILGELAEFEFVGLADADLSIPSDDDGFDDADGHLDFDML